MSRGRPNKKAMQMRQSCESLSRLFKAQGGKSADVSPWQKHSPLSPSGDQQDENSSSGETIGPGLSEHGDSGSLASQSLPVSFTCRHLTSPETESPARRHSGELSPCAHTSVSFRAGESAPDMDFACGAKRHTFTSKCYHQPQVQPVDSCSSSGGIETSERVRRQLWPCHSSSESSDEGETLALASDGSRMSDEQLACMIAHSLTQQRRPKQRQQRRRRGHGVQAANDSAEETANSAVIEHVPLPNDEFSDHVLGMAVPRLPLSRSVSAIAADGNGVS
jgi:hypothetical protein